MKHLISLLFLSLIIGFCLTTEQNPIAPLCQNIVGYINAARTHRGIKALKVSDFLNNFAEKQSETQAKNKCLEVSSKASLDALKVNAYGENVYSLYTNKGDKHTTKQYAASVVSSWLQDKSESSKGHRKNLLNINFNYVGCSFSQGEINHYFITVTFVSIYNDLRFTKSVKLVHFNPTIKKIVKNPPPTPKQEQKRTDGFGHIGATVKKIGKPVKTPEIKKPEVVVIKTPEIKKPEVVKHTKVGKPEVVKHIIGKPIIVVKKPKVKKHGKKKVKKSSEKEDWHTEIRMKTTLKHGKKAKKTW